METLNVYINNSKSVLVLTAEPLHENSKVEESKVEESKVSKVVEWIKTKENPKLYSGFMDKEKVFLPELKEEKIVTIGGINFDTEWLKEALTIPFNKPESFILTQDVLCIRDEKYQVFITRISENQSNTK